MTLSVAFLAAVLVLDAPAQIDLTASQRLLDAASSGGDRYGHALAMDGSRLAVGAPGDGAGTVSVYTRAGGAWQLEAELSVAALDPFAPASFGASLALQGDRLVIGAPEIAFGGSQSGSGKVFVYERSASGWALSAELSLSPANGLFGSAVALDGDRLVVGAPGASVAQSIYSGAAFVFERASSVWTPAAVLAPSDAWHGFEFGASVGLHADEVVVGAPERAPLGGGADGALYVYSRGAAGWQEDQILVDTLAPAQYRLGKLGRCLAFDGTTIVSGDAPGVVSSYGARGALVFARSAAGWGAFQRLTSSVTSEFGSAVALEGDTIVVGARNSVWTSGSFASGAATLWRREPTGWSERWRMLDAPPVSNARFGASVALSNGEIAIGSPDAPWDSQASVGAVSIYTAPSTVGELLCFGDGSGSACPCGAQAHASHGPGCSNSRGWGAVLLASGSASISADDLALTAAQLIPAKSAMLAFRSGTANGGFGVALHDGLLCLSGAGGRLGLRTAGGYPFTATWGPALASQVGANAGSTAYFQVWYRDPTGPCGSGSNLTNALKVSFVP